MVGIERSGEAVAMARALVTERGLTNVEVLELDARHTGLPAASFDAATSSFSSMFRNRMRYLLETVRIVRPGGWDAFHEADYVSHVCDPPLEASSAIVDLIVAYSDDGIDPFIGRKLPRLMRAAGIVDVVVNPILHTSHRGIRGVASCTTSPRISPSVSSLSA